MVKTPEIGCCCCTRSPREASSQKFKAEIKSAEMAGLYLNHVTF